MKTVNNILILLTIISTISCKKEVARFSKSEINYDADTLTYKLNVLNVNSDSVYGINNRGESNLLVLKKIYVLNTCFGGLDNISKAVEYAKKHKNDIKNSSDFRMETTINIKNEKNIYEEVWLWKDFISLFYKNVEGINSFGLTEGRIQLEECYLKHNNRMVEWLKIIFNETGLEGGFKLNILNFIRNGSSWELISRERINTKLNDITKEQIGYCVDTIFSNCKSKFKNHEKIFITNTMLFDLDNAKCY